MKRIIEGKLYNTETAEKLCELSCTYNRGDFGWHCTHLYRTRKSAFFLAGEGNARSMWAHHFSNGSGSGDGIRVIDADEAKSIMEKEASIEDYAKVFGEPEEA
jgi:hypothetical protein